MAAMHGRPTSSGRSFRLLLVCAAVAYGPCAGRSILRCGARRDHNLSSAGEHRTVGSSHAPIFELSEPRPARSEEQTSELQSLMRISYAVFCLKKKNSLNAQTHTYLIWQSTVYKEERQQRMTRRITQSRTIN